MVGVMLPAILEVIVAFHDEKEMRISSYLMLVSWGCGMIETKREEKQLRYGKACYREMCQVKVLRGRQKQESRQ